MGKAKNHRRRTNDLPLDQHPELERKFVLKNLAKTENARRAYRAIFQAVVKDREGFPDLSALAGLKTRRSVEYKDGRHRLYYADADFIAARAHWELRLQVDSGLLMIKQGNGADNDHPTLDRQETKYQMARPIIGTLDDIRKNSENSRKAPKALRELFNDRVKDCKLYPVVETCSTRNKLVYYRPVRHAGREYRIAFEFALDKGEARVIDGSRYKIDQIELEVKRVVDTETGIDVLDHPDALSLTIGEVKKDIVEPALDEEQQLLVKRFSLKSVFDSKPKIGLARAKVLMQTDEGMVAAEAARDRHLSASFWQSLKPESVAV